MRAMVLERPATPLVETERETPVPGPGQLRLRVKDIPSFAYRLLWEERVVRSVANLTRKDGDELLALAPRAGVRTEVVPFPLTAANEALARLRAGKVRGAAVLAVG